MLKDTEKPVRAANRLIRIHGTRDPERLAEELDITVVPCRFKRQKGVYKVIERNRYIFISDSLDPATYAAVLLHEIGHDQLHRGAAVKAGGLKELDIFAMADLGMEYEANLFAAQIAVPEDELLEYIAAGYDTESIARMMGADANLVALKASELSRRGYNLRAQTVSCDFLK